MLSKNTIIETSDLSYLLKAIIKIGDKPIIPIKNKFLLSSPNAKAGVTESAIIISNKSLYAIFVELII